MADMGIKELKPSIHGNLGSWGHAALASLVTSSHGSGLRKLLQRATGQDGSRRVRLPEPAAELLLHAPHEESAVGRSGAVALPAS